MREIGERAELVLEVVEQVRVERAQRLERHDHVAFAIARFVDHAHAALTEGPAYLEPRTTHPRPA
jgi:hypothetical protein